MASFAPSSTPILQTEAHLHLYGCLTAADLWEIGRDRYQKLSPRMEWFAAEYAKTFGQTPDWKAWWTRDCGFEGFKKVFEFTAPGPFSEFQAKFNLLIALNPPDPQDLELAHRVFSADAKTGGTKEYRTFLPMYLSDHDRESYLVGLLRKAQEMTSKNYRPLVALSLMREGDIAETSYAWLQDFSRRHLWSIDLITGIDFCASEVGHPPTSFGPWIFSDWSLYSCARFGS